MLTLQNILIGTALITICSTSLSKEPDRTELALVPYPQEIKLLAGTFIPKKDLILSFKKDSREISQIAKTCVQDFQDIGFSASYGKSLPEDKSSTIKLVIQDDESLGKEGYRLTIHRDISISATTTDGLFWGTRTLMQLLQAGPQKEIPHLTITDKPEFGYRGLMIDNARKFHSLDFHIKTIKRLASLKLNRYHIHFSDNSSYTLPSKAFPELPTKDRHYTIENIKTLVGVARHYHVMIIPEIDVPGHAAALRRGIKGIGCTDNGKSWNKLCIGNERTYDVLQKLFSEIMQMIPGDYWHLGADEVSYKGHTCKTCASRMKQNRLKDGKQLFNYFINRMHETVKSEGRTMLVWEGFSPTIEPKVSTDIIVCPFDIKNPGHMPSDYFKAGYSLLNTSWTPLYVADHLYMTTPEIIARWSPYMFGAGRSPQPFSYWKKFNKTTHQGKIIGAQVCSWNNEEKAEEGLLFGTGPGFHDYGRPGPRLQIMAERVWTGSSTSTKGLLERVAAEYW